MRRASHCGRGILACLLLLAAQPAAAATLTCLTGTAARVANDPAAIRATRDAIDADCPCAKFDGTDGKTRHAYRRCARTVIDMLIGTGILRKQCRGRMRRTTSKSTCGLPASAGATVCLREDLATGSLSCSIQSASSCRGTSGVDRETRCTSATRCLDAADSNGDLLIAAPGDSGRCASPAPTPTPAANVPGPYPTGPNGQRLAELVNQYRVANGKPALPLSPVLMAVAAAHVYDLTQHAGTDSGVCTPHSWSNQGGLLWTGCCYTIDAAQADCMWRKPREISTGLGLTTYPGAGYEIALRGTPEGTPEQVLAVFADSPPHRDVILSTNGWEFLDLHPAMGAATREGYSVVWFGDATDPN